MRREPRDGHQDADEEVSRPDAKERLQRIPEGHLPFMQRGAIESPRKHRTKCEDDP